MQRRQFLEGVGGASLALLLGNACGDSSETTGADDAGGSGDGSSNGTAGNGTGANANGDDASGGNNGGATSGDGGGANAGSSNGVTSGNGNAQDAGGMSDSGVKTDAGTPMAACAAVISAQITCRHDHKLEIPAADIKAGLQKVYDIRGASTTHGHDVTVTAAHFAALKRGEVVKIFVESNIQFHNLYLSCAMEWKPAARDNEECK